MISILLPVLVALSGAGFYVYNWYMEPNFSHGQYYTSAWIEYGVNQNTLNVEYETDLKGSMFPAIREALQRMDVKSHINSKIDGKPVLVVGYVRYKTHLVETARVLITHNDIHIMETGTFEERQALLLSVKDRAEASYNLTHVMIKRPDGRVEYILVTNETFDPDRIYNDFITSSEDRFYA
jgi:hypothetical protein